jgi:hypothetical protein
MGIMGKKNVLTISFANNKKKIQYYKTRFAPAGSKITNKLNVYILTNYYQ